MAGLYFGQMEKCVNKRKSLFEVVYCQICGTDMDRKKISSKVSPRAWKEKRSHKGVVQIMYKCPKCGKVL